MKIGMEQGDKIDIAYPTGSYSDGDYSISRITKVGEWYHLELSVTTTNEHATSTAIAIIPTGYRPSQKIWLPAILRATSNNIMFPTAIQVFADGTIAQGATGAFKGCYVDAWYHS